MLRSPHAMLVQRLPWARTLAALPACAALAFGCGGALAVDDEATDGPAAEAKPEPFKLCDGSSDVRFVFKGGGVSGPVRDGAELFYELGSLLVIDGQCRFGISTAGVWGQVATGHLSQELEEGLVTELRLREWSSLRRPCGSALDRWSVSVAGEEMPRLERCPINEDARPPDPRPGEIVATWFSSAARALLGSLINTATEPTGPVRYAIVALPARTGIPLGPFPWTLDFAAGVRGPAVSTAEDGARLREVRRQYRGRPSAAKAARDAPLPFVTPAGARFGVYFREILPWEGPDGRLPF